MHINNGGIIMSIILSIVVANVKDGIDATFVPGNICDISEDRSICDQKTPHSAAVSWYVGNVIIGID
jgi:hypothetical protein